MAKTDIKFAKAIGANTDLLTAQAFIYSSVPQSEQDYPLYFAVLISGTGEDVFTNVRQVGTSLQEKFFEMELPVPSRFEQLKIISKEELSGVEDLQVLLASWAGEVLYIQSFGSHKAYLYRDNKLLDLHTNSSNKQLISGYLKPADRLFLITSPENDSWDEYFINNLIKSDPENLEDELETYLSQRAQSDPIATILIEKEANLEPQTENTQPVFTNAALEYQAGQSLSPKFSWPMINLRVLKRFLAKFFPKSPKAVIVLLVVVAVLIISGISFFRLHKQQAQTNAKFLSFLNNAKSKYSDAQNQKDSGTAVASQDLIEAKKDLDQALKINPHSRDALNFKKELDQNSDNILKIYQVNDFPVFLSLDLIKPGFLTQHLSLSLGKLLLLDDKQKTLVTIDLAKKTPQILAGSTQLGKADFASINGSNAFVFSEDKGVLRVALDDNKITTVAKTDDSWGKISDIFGFAGNVYLLDSLKNQIWKYTPVKSGYSDKISYLKDGTKVDLAGAKRLQVDYSVWVLKSGPEMFRFTGGEKDSFAVSGLDKNLQELTSFYAAEPDTIADYDNSLLYLLDSQNSRLVVLKKNGQYVSQYIGDKFKTATDLVVDKESKKIYLLEGGKIYQIDLR